MCHHTAGIPMWAVPAWHRGPPPWRLVKTGEDWQKHTRRPDFGSSSGQKASTSLSSSLISLVHWGSHVVFHIFPLIYDHCIMKIHTARLTYRIWTYHPHRTSEILGALTDGRWAKAAKVPRQRVHDALDVVQLPLERVRDRIVRMERTLHKTLLYRLYLFLPVPTLPLGLSQYEMKFG